MNMGKMAAIGILLALGAPCLGAVTLTGSTTLSGGDYYVGNTADGSLGIDAGSIVSDVDGYIGYNLGCTGTATISGAGSQWTHLSGLDVGYSGVGTINIEAGGQVSARGGILGRNVGSSGVANVTGQGSAWTSTTSFYVGWYGAGRLRVEAGALLTSGTGWLGYYAGSSGSATVSGADSAWVVSGDFNSGLNGNGALTVEGGGRVSSAKGYVGYAASSSGTAIVTGLGSTWYCSDCLYVGKSGSGALDIEAGGQVSDRTGYVGGILAGTATVAGPNSRWTHSQEFFIGNGRLAILAGGQVSNNLDGHIGYASSESGMVVVTGTASRWINSLDLHVGHYGTGTLTVSEGGSVTARTLYAAQKDLYGNGTITASGAVLDAVIAFDGTSGTARVAFGSGGMLTVNPDGTGVLGAGFKGAGALLITNGNTVSSSGGQLGTMNGSDGTVIVSGVGSNWINAGTMWIGAASARGLLRVEAGAQVRSTVGYVGYGFGATGEAIVTGEASAWTNSGDLFVADKQTGTLRVEEGGCVSCESGWVGFYSSSKGTVTVNGTGSTWTTSSGLVIGNYGNGALRIEDGGVVNSSSGYIGWGAGIGAVTLTGAGSTWASSGTVYVGNVGKGALSVAGGCRVTAMSLAVSTTQSAASLSVSENEVISLGSSSTVGSVTNKGAINFYAGAFLPVGSYTPICEYASRTMTWSGTGAYVAYGGTWSATTHAFTVAAPTVLAAGAVDSIGSGERMLFTDAVGRRVGASFGTVSGGKTFSAATMTASELSLLKATTGFAGAALVGWDFATNLTGSQVMLSFDIGLGARDVEVWHLVGSTWTQYTPDLLTYDSHGIVSFTVASFSGYAVADAAALLGDANRDGIVDQADYTVWYNNYGASGGWTSGDFNGDNLVDQADYTIWYNNYGTTGGSVPEPATLMLLAIGGVAMLRRRK